MVERLKVVKKVWGREIWFHEDGGKSCGYIGKILEYKPGYKSSLHYHPQKHETMYVVIGKVLIKYKPIGCQAFIERVLEGGDVIIFPPETPHQLIPLEYTNIFEVSTPHDDDDVVRLEPSGEVE